MSDLTIGSIGPIVLITGAAAFLLVLSVWLLGTTIIYMRRVRREEQISARLSADHRGAAKVKTLRLWHNGGVGTTTVLEHITPGVLTRWFERTRTGLGWGGPVSTFVVFLFALLSVGFVLIFGLTQNVVFCLVWLVLLPIILNFIAARRSARGAAVFERQLADALGLATRSLRAGHPLMSAFQVIVDELDAPISTVFAEIVQQQQLGKSLEEAIRATAAKSHSDDLKLFAASTIIQLRSGGNLADMMERLVAVIRDRIRLQRRVRVLTAQTQFSKRVLICMPFVLVLMLMVMKSEYLMPLWTTHIGRILIGVAGVFLVAGSWVMNKIAVLKY